ncbi:MAG: ABC transporter substrate-binding protein [Burkholderiales bacterium]
MTSRRRFLALALAPSVAPLATAQPAGAPRRIATLSAFPRGDVDVLLAALKRELERLGWVDGRTIAFLPPRLSEGRYDILPALAAEVAGLAPDVVVVQSAPATRAMARASATIPIVMVGVGDPVAFGLVQSYASPGANVTGSSYLAGESSRKALQVLKEIAPGIRSVAVFVNPGNDGTPGYVRDMREAGTSLALRVQVAEVAGAADFDGAFGAIVRERTESLIIGPEPLLRAQRAAIAAFALRERLPFMIVGGSRYLDSGALAAYGPSFDQYPALTARYVDRILRGAKPATLAIEQPAKFDLAINVAAAKAIGLGIPEAVLARADEVIR